MTDATLNRFISSGTNAERLAFTPDPPTPASGPDPSYIWFETDTLDTYAWDYAGSSWEQVNTGGAAAGLVDGDYGDVTSAGGTITIDAGAVTLVKQANMATASVVYRKTAGAGAPEVQTLATLKTDLALTGTNSGDQTTIVGITGTKAEFDAAVSDGNIVYVGDSPELTAVNLGHASDTTITRTGAGDIAVEGNTVYRAGGTDVPVADGGTGASTAAGAATNLGLGTGDSPQFTAINLGHASDTTLTRTGAGDAAIEGNAIYRAGGTDVPLADGGTGASLADPGADRILFWDDSGGAATWLTPGTGLTIADTTITASGEVLIEEYTGDGTTGTKTFSGIPAYRALKLVWSVRSSVSATSESMLLTFNGDGGANYDRQHITGTGSTVNTAESLAATSVSLTVSGNTATAGAVGAGVLEIPDYAGTTFHKSGVFQSSFKTTTSSGGIGMRPGILHYRSTSAISSLTLALTSGNFVTGSKLLLYGIQ